MTSRFHKLTTSTSTQSICPLNPLPLPAASSLNPISTPESDLVTQTSWRRLQRTHWIKRYVPVFSSFLHRPFLSRGGGILRWLNSFRSVNRRWWHIWRTGRAFHGLHQSFPIWTWIWNSPTKGKRNATLFCGSATSLQIHRPSPFRKARTLRRQTTSKLGISQRPYPPPYHHTTIPNQTAFSLLEIAITLLCNRHPTLPPPTSSLPPSKHSFSTFTNYIHIHHHLRSLQNHRISAGNTYNTTTIMGVRDVKIGYATSSSGPSSPQPSLSSQDIANLMPPFPRARPDTPTTPPTKPTNSRANVPPARYSSMVLNQAKVKSVLSGDSLVLSSVDNPDRERILSLAYCTSPHLKKEGDEQWAYDSRDALRKMVVGKLVQFQVLYTIPNTKREYGIVYLNDGRRLPEEMVQEGWLKLREDAGRKEDSQDALSQLDRLRLLEATARSEDKGQWQPSGGRINVQHDMGNAQAFLDNYKGETVDGLVERVLSGDRMLVRLIISPTEHIQGKIIVFFCLIDPY